MGWQTTGDVAEFLAAAGAFLRAERARNTVFLTVTETMRVNPAQYRGGDDADPARLPLFGWWTVAGGVRCAFMHTPDFPVLLTALPAAVAADLAAQTLAGRPLTGVNAYPEAAKAFGAAWREQTGGRVAVHRRMRLYRLAGLSWPSPMPDGVPRTAGEGDVALLTDWLTAFGREVNDMERGDLAASIRERYSYGGLTLWEADGRPVSVAGLTRQAAGMVRVGPVYTPPELRGHGYASAATAEVSRTALAAGAEEVLLYTDLANPVSNAIYQRIGYEQVEDRVVLSFSRRLPPAGNLAPPGQARRYS
jgi:RimJ/RimL family protein N-acetyltransferase